MRYVAPPLAELTARAQTLTSAGDLAGAREVLADVLRTADADPRRATADLAVAAALHARVLIALGDPQSARLWAAFAHAAEERLHGPGDERAIAAAATHAAVLQQVGHPGRAALVYRDLVGELTAVDGAQTPRVLAAEADLATAEHAAGDCAAARSRLSGAWRRHRRVFGDAAPAGIKMLARLGAMERECGHDAESREHLALAQELSARHLPADHPLARQAAALAAGTRSGRHTCARPKPESVPEPVAEPAAEPGRPGFRPFPRRPTVTDPAVRRSPFPAAAPGQPPPDDRPTDPNGTVYPVVDDPGRPPPDDRPTDPNGTVYQQPLYLSDLGSLLGDPSGLHARADTPPPLPGAGVPAYGPDGRPAQIGTARASTATAAPHPARLPVPLDRPDPRRPAHPLLLATVLAGGVAAAAAVVILTLPDADGATGTPGASRTTGPAGAAPTPPGNPPGSATTSPPDAPQDLRLTDGGGRITLRWTYPAQAGGQVVVSGGRTGEKARTVQTLPARATDYVLYNLNEQLNYCFTVAVRQPGGRLAASAPACTRRG